MKKFIIATAAVAAFSLSAGVSADECDAGTLCEVEDSATDFIAEGFDLQLSTGVALEYVQSTTAVGVGTFHAKGNSAFAGTSEGGQIIPCGEKPPEMPTVVSSGSGATGC